MTVTHGWRHYATHEPMVDLITIGTAGVALFGLFDAIRLSRHRRLTWYDVGYHLIIIVALGFFCVYLSASRELG